MSGRRRERWFGVVLLAATFVAALLAACRERLPARFPHRAHLMGPACGSAGEAACLSCNTCHAPSAADRAHKLPEAALCERCHQRDLGRVTQVLHVEPPRPYGAIGFDHDRHLAMAGIEGQCIPCHAGVVEAGKPNIPPMAQCFTCHEHERQWRRGECTPCHREADLRRTLPVTFLRHDSTFARRHGTEAAQQAHLCQSCHAQADCDGCHDLSQALPVERRRPEKVEASFVHRGDFMTRHALEAEAQPSACLRCHAPETCDACHAVRGVSGALSNGRNPHPPGWIGADVGARSFHGTEARRDILACAACHDQGPATNCIRCHKVGAYGGNPHPEGFSSSRGFDAAMCRYCHE